MALQTVPMRCCDDLLILKGVDRHEKVGKASLNRGVAARSAWREWTWRCWNWRTCIILQDIRTVLCVGVIQQRSVQCVQ